MIATGTSTRTVRRQRKSYSTPRSGASRCGVQQNPHLPFPSLTSKHLFFQLSLPLTYPVCATSKCRACSLQLTPRSLAGVRRTCARNSTRPPTEPMSNRAMQSRRTRVQRGPFRASLTPDWSGPTCRGSSRLQRVRRVEAGGSDIDGRICSQAYPSPSPPVPIVLKGVQCWEVGRILVPTGFLSLADDNQIRHTGRSYGRRGRSRRRRPQQPRVRQLSAALNIWSLRC